MRVKAGQQVIDAIRLAYAADKPVLLEGKHGVGKSQIVEQAAAQLGVGFIVRDLSLLEPPDLVGLPVITDGVTRYASPAFLPTSGKGLFCFEELNRSEKYMMAPCLQLMTARCLNDYQLPKGFLPVAAINPSDDGSYQVNELDPALLSRFVRIEIMADAVEWLNWADNNGVHGAVTKYVKNTPDVFEGDQSNPRAWAYVSDVLKAFENGSGATDDILTVAVSGIVGDVHCAAFLWSYSKSEEPLSATTIINEYSRYRHEVLKWCENKRMDMLNATTRNVLVALQDCDVCNNIAGNEAKQACLGDFINDLPGDLGKKVRDTARRNGATP